MNRTNDDSPAAVQQMSAPELKRWLDEGRPMELFDVRTPDEQAIARIEGARLLDQCGYEYLLSLDRGTPVVFHCHLGVRSQAAAEYCLRELGFRHLYNVAGGIDAWSVLVDPSVPRY